MNKYIINLIRDISNKQCTFGRLFLNNYSRPEFCYTLEDCYRLEKIAKETCILEGEYKVIVNISKRFGVELPLLLNVPNFVGVRIHNGNTDKDTEGCILVAKNRDIQNNKIFGSSKELTILLKNHIKEKIEKGFEVFLKIENRF